MFPAAAWRSGGAEMNQNKKWDVQIWDLKNSN
jgi:hypothetical protein